jgi:hypothetical protein
MRFFMAHSISQHGKSFFPVITGVLLQNCQHTHAFTHEYRSEPENLFNRAATRVPPIQALS